MHDYQQYPIRAPKVGSAIISVALMFHVHVGGGVFATWAPSLSDGGREGATQTRLPQNGPFCLSPFLVNLITMHGCSRTSAGTVCLSLVRRNGLAYFAVVDISGRRSTRESSSQRVPKTMYLCEPMSQSSFHFSS